MNHTQCGGEESNVVCLDVVGLLSKSAVSVDGPRLSAHLGPIATARWIDERLAALEKERKSQAKKSAESTQNEEAEPWRRRLDEEWKAAVTDDALMLGVAYLKNTAFDSRSALEEQLAGAEAAKATKTRRRRRHPPTTCLHTLSEEEYARILQGKFRRSVIRCLFSLVCVQ